MSRAFVKETDDAPDEPLPDRPLSEHPNYVTASGLERLHARVAELEAARLELARRSAADEAARDRLRYVERDLRYFRRRLATARPVAPAGGERVSFGATVAVRDDDGREQSYRIVGEDEAEPERGLASWVSPLARVLDGARVGDHVVWRRPAGALGLTIVAIEADAPASGPAAPRATDQGET
jgi:transcription elongation GreA/GreB family factor